MLEHGSHRTSDVPRSVGFVLGVLAWPSCWAKNEYWPWGYLSVEGVEDLSSWERKESEGRARVGVSGVNLGLFLGQGTRALWRDHCFGALPVPL